MALSATYSATHHQGESFARHWLLSWRGALLLLVVLIVAARIALPWYLVRYVNGVLNRNETYEGHVDEIDVHLWRGAYQIHGIVIQKRAKVPIPFFKSPLVDLSLQWKALFDGALVGKVDIEHAELNFVRGPSKAVTQTGQERDWTQVVKDLFPLRINQLEVKESQVHYRDLASDPKVDVEITQVNGVATNLTNSRKISKTLVATADANGNFERHAPLKVHVDLDPYAKSPTFYLNVALERLDLTKLNDALRAYGAVDAESGTISVYTELRAENKRLEGYVKPIVKDMKILNLKEDEKKPIKLLWEGLVAAVSEIFTNHSHDQIATKIPIAGSIDQPQPGTWTGLFRLVGNAFIKAIKPGSSGELRGLVDTVKGGEGRRSEGKSDEGKSGKEKTED